MSQQATEIPFGLKARSLICGMMVNFLFGTFYAFSNTYIYVSNYLRQFDKEIDEQGRRVMFAMPVWLFCQCVFTVVSVRVADKIGWWALNYIAFVWFCLNNLAMVFIKSYWQFLLVYGVGNGMAFGLGYLPAIYISWTYFPDRKSLSTGCLLFSTAISTCILSPLATHIVNPNNLPDDDQSVIDRVPLLFRCFTIIFLVISLIACSLLPPPYILVILEEKKGKDKGKGLEEKIQGEGTMRIRNLGMLLDLTRKGATREDLVRIAQVRIAERGAAADQEAFMMMGQLEENQMKELAFNEPIGPDSEEITDIEGGSTENKLDVDVEGEIQRLDKVSKEGNCPSVREGLGSITFVMLCFMVVCVACYCYFMLTTWKNYFKQYLKMRDKQLSYLLSFGAVMNALGRLLTGLSLLKVSFKWIYMPTVLVSSICAFSLEYVMSTLKNEIIAIAYVGVAFYALGTSVTVFPTICMKVFGVQVGSRIYPFVYVCFSIGCGLSYLLSRVCPTVQFATYVIGGLGVCGFLLSIFFNDKPDWSSAKSIKSRENSDNPNIELK